MPIQRKCDRCDTILPSSDSSTLCSECIAAEAAALRLKTGQVLPPSHASVASKPHAPASKLERTGSRVNPAKAPYEPLPVASLTKISVLKKFVRDHRSLVGAAVGILLVLTMAIVLTSVMTIRGREKSRIIAPQTSNNQIPQKVRAKPEDNLPVSDASRQQLLRLQALNGRNAIEQGDEITAGLWFAECLKTSKGNPQEEKIHRLRLEWLLAEYPRLALVFRQGGPVNSCKFSPDGQKVITASQDRTARVWNATTGEAITPPLKHNGPVVFAALSPDGKRALTASSDGTVQLWNAVSGARIAPPLQHGGPVTTASFNPSGDRILTASSDGTARLWDASSGATVMPPMRHNGLVLCAAFSPDGKRVATGSADRTAQLWDAKSGERLGPPLQHAEEVVCLSFDLTGARLATGTVRENQSPSSCWLWNVESAQLILGPLTYPGRLRVIGFAGEPQRMIGAGSSGGVLLWDSANGRAMTTEFKQIGAQYIAFSPDKQSAVTATDLNSTVFGWDVQNGKRTFPPLKHGLGATYADFSSNGEQVLTASQDGLVRLWNLTSQTECLTLSQDAEVLTACFSPDGKWILTGGLERSAHLWNSINGQHLLWLKTSNHVAQAMFSKDGSRIVTSPGFVSQSYIQGTTVCIWDAATGKLIGKPLVHPTNVLAASISDDGRLAATASLEGVVQVWNTDRGEPVGPPLTHSNSVRSIAFSADGQRTLTASTGGAMVWIWRTGAHAFPPLRDGTGLNFAKYSPDGMMILTGGQDGSARVWNASTGNPISPPVKMSGSVHHASFSPDCKRVVLFGTGSPRLRIWDTTTGEQAVPTIEHAHAVQFAEFSPDGDLLVTASEDTAFVWDAHTGERLSPPLRHANTIYQARFDPQGRRLLTASADRTVRLWTLPHNEMSNADLALLTEVSAGRVYNQSGGFTTLPPERLQAGLQQLRASYPAAFSILPKDALTWHDTQSLKAEASGNWPSAAWHLAILLEGKTGDPDLRRRCARAFLRAGRPSEALKLYEDLLKFMKTNPSLENGKTRGIIEDLASAYWDAGRFADAEGWYRELAAYWRITGAPDNVELGLTLSSQGHCLLKQDKFAQAEPVLSEGLAILKKQQPGLSPTYTAQSLLGMSLLGQKKYQEAEPLLEEAYEGLSRRQQQRPSTSHAQQVKAAGRRLVQLYEAWGKPDKAVQWKKALSQGR